MKNEMSRDSKLHMLIILDGWGIRSTTMGNAVSIADTPFLDELQSAYPHTQLACSGEAVGLPGGVMGNSEVGHLNIGAGRTVYQSLLRINKAIRDGRFNTNPVFTGLMSTVREKGSALHLMGLVSDGGVHSHIDHLLALLDMAQAEGLQQVFVHAILDGRDTPPDSGVDYLAQLQDHMHHTGFGRLATICGRYYAMDRDTRWDRSEMAYRLYARGEGAPAADPIGVVKAAYKRNETDEFISPIVMVNPQEKPVATVGEGDGVLFFNFRADRARQITQALTDPGFESFDRGPFPTLSGYVCMTQYDKAFDLPAAFMPVWMTDLLGEVISKQGLRQLRIAETEKYAHVTYFFNGGGERPFPGEERCLIPSPREIPTYDLKPEMSAYRVTDEVLRRMRSGSYDLIVLNFANMDMVGHTGILDAAVRACEAVDACLKDIIAEVIAAGGIAMITADHGNAEMMRKENGDPFTAHTTNPVPLLLIDETRKHMALKPGKLGDIAPTLLALMGIDQPEGMTGNCLLS